uniref:Uncharacterized protein n=1 Tax=Eutreptiella gymnastica TaxID=73025 RepID=A0A7S1ISP9_9EUGL|mmetsp:Transcript_39140/g.70198  ORF Transcript_39140/g.70198 Transcript_39140/m.70198 type:complete len:105 (+) Transcript_39140:282-596(+)
MKGQKEIRRQRQRGPRGPAEQEQQADELSAAGAQHPWPLIGGISRRMFMTHLNIENQEPDGDHYCTDFLNHCSEIYALPAAYDEEQRPSMATMPHMHRHGLQLE